MPKGNPMPVAARDAVEIKQLLDRGYIIPAPTPEMINTIFSRPKHQKSYQTREELLTLVTHYFQQCIAEVVDPDTGETTYKYVRPPSMAELAVFLGVTRETLRKYRHNDENGDIICSAVDVIAAYNEQCLISLDSKRNPAAHIFMLKANFGYKEESTVNVNYTMDTKQPKSIDEIRKAVEEDVIDIEFDEVD